MRKEVPKLMRNVRAQQREQAVCVGLGGGGEALTKGWESEQPAPDGIQACFSSGRHSCPSHSDVCLVIVPPNLNSSKSCDYRDTIRHVGTTD